MIESKSDPIATNDGDDVVAAGARWNARIDLERYRAETERLRVLADFLARPVHAHGGGDPDPDIITAYNLAVEAALHGIRQAASSDRATESRGC